MPHNGVERLPGSKNMTITFKNVTACAFAGVLLILILGGGQAWGSLNYYSFLVTSTDSNGVPVPIRSLVAAERLCLAQASKIYGQRLFRTDIDDHSSRFDQPRNLFLVLLQAKVGSRTDSREYTLHCRIQHLDHTISYLKAIDVQAE